MPLSTQNIANLWVQEGGSPRYARLMARIAKRESGGRPRINNRGTNSNGTVDWGLYQVNDVWRKDPVIGPMFHSGEILTPEGATRAAIRILKVQGPKAWATYNPGTDKQYLGGFRGAAQKSSPGGTRTGTRYKLQRGSLPTTKTDVSGALVDALLAHPKGGLLQAAMHAVESGQYTTTTPGKESKLVKLAGGAARPASDVAGGSVKGAVKVAPGANRAGVGVQPIVTRFLSHVAGSLGQPITITTGTNHNRLTVDGNVSDHWDGHGADIAVPVDSEEGNRIATRAIHATGVPLAKARQMARQGGLYNLSYHGHRVQVIWKTMQGGNHHNHVHIGIR